MRKALCITTGTVTTIPPQGVISQVILYTYAYVSANPVMYTDPKGLDQAQTDAMLSFVAKIESNTKIPVTGTRLIFPNRVILTSFLASDKGGITESNTGTVFLSYQQYGALIEDCDKFVQLYQSILHETIHNTIGYIKSAAIDNSGLHDDPNLDNPGSIAAFARRHAKAARPAIAAEFCTCKANF